MQRVVDARGEHPDVVAQADHRRHLERLQPAHDHDQDRCVERRLRERQRHAKEDARHRRAAHDRRLLERRIHRAERRHHQQEHEWREMESLDEDHAGQAVDIERAEAELLDEARVRDPVVRIEQERPRDRMQDPGDDQRHDRRRVHQGLAGHVGAHEQIGERGADDESEHRRAEREDERVEQHRPEPDGAVRVAKRGDGEMPASDERLPDQEADGDEREIRDRDRDEQNDQVARGEEAPKRLAPVAGPTSQRPRPSRSAPPWTTARRPVRPQLPAVSAGTALTE